MQIVETYQSRRAVPAPEILCGPLDAFNGADLESVRRVFQFVTPCLLQQSWRNEAQAQFSPGMARIGWRGTSFFVFAELTDRDIFNRATGLNQRTWELGDVFEIFLGAAEGGSYIEFHVTPGNQRLQLRYADGYSVARARKTGDLNEFLIPGEAFRSMTWVENHAHGWSVLAEIPISAVCGSHPPVDKTRWQFSFGRYDYTRGAMEPCISSTSPHAEPDFHRRHEWGVLTFKMRS